MKIFYITKNYLLKKIELQYDEDTETYSCTFPEKVFIMGATEENENFFNQLNDLEKQFLNTFSPSTLKDSSAIDIEYFRPKNSEFRYSNLPPVISVQGTVLAGYAWIDTLRPIVSNLLVVSSDGSTVSQDIELLNNDDAWFIEDNILYIDETVYESGHPNELISPLNPGNGYPVGVQTKKCYVEGTNAPLPSDIVIGQDYPLVINKFEGDDWSLYPATRITFGLSNPPPGLSMGADYVLKVAANYEGLIYQVLVRVYDDELNQLLFQETFDYGVPV